MEVELLESVTLLTNAQVCSLFSNPIVLIPFVPGSIIVPVQMIVEVDTTAGALSDSLQWRLRYFGTVLNIINLIAVNLVSTPWKGTSISGHGAGFSPGETTATLCAAGIVLATDKDTTGGDASNRYRVTVRYYLHTPTIA